MNKRIRQLAEQAEITLVLTEFTGCLSGQDFLVIDRNLTVMQLEKFAELIVRECIQVGGPEDSYTDDWFMAKAHSVAKIKEHFGVEL